MGKELKQYAIALAFVAAARTWGPGETRMISFVPAVKQLSKMGAFSSYLRRVPRGAGFSPIDGPGRMEARTGNWRAC